MTHQKKSFTLIELLVVVAVIAILAAIAVPNFLEAQTRAKVSRVRADQRTIATGVEIYRVDNNRYPAYHYCQDRQFFMGGTVDNGFTATNLPKDRRGPSITTPISYLTSYPNDPFYASEYQKFGEAWNDHRQMMYVNWRVAIQQGVFNQVDGEAQINIAGEWRITSAGPDASRFEKPGDTVNIPYDSTNGTVSLGGVHRFQSDPTGNRE